MSNSKKITILILDDEKFIRDSLVDYLEDADFHVFSAGTAERALEIINKEHIDVAIVDIRLPDRDGNSFVIEANVLCPDISYIIHTGSVDYTVNSELQKLGITDADVLKKPVNNLSIFTGKIKKLTSQ